MHLTHPERLKPFTFRTLRTLASLGLTLGMLVPTAQAAVTITIAEVGANVTMTGSGSINTSGLTAGTIGPVFGSYLRANPFTVGAAPTSGSSRSYTPMSGPVNIGSGTTFATGTNTGDIFIIYGGSVPQIELPAGYGSGNSLSFSSTFANQSLSSLGITSGTYTYTLGNGETVVVTVNAPPVVNVDGACGTASGTTATATAPTANLCSAGTATTVAGASNGKWNWDCNGSGSGTSTTGNACSAPYASQAITGLAANPASLTIGGTTSATLSGTRGVSGNDITYTSATTGICSVSGSTVSATGAGTCTVKANQAGTGDSGTSRYLAAPEASLPITVNAGSQTISFTSTAPAAAVVGGSTYTPAATGGASGNPVTISLDATSTGCALSRGVVSFTAVGTCVINANQAGSVNYNAAAQVQQSFAIGKGSQTISAFSANPAALQVGGTSTLSATKGPGSAAVVYSSKTTATCTVAGNTVTAVAAGTCTVAANQAESANHNAAPEVTANLTVTNAAPVASNVAVTGTAQVGVQLTGSYNYSDTESDAQGTSTFRWVRQSNPTADVATTQNYTPAAGDVGNALKFCVTPVASAGTATGTEVCSSATAAVVAPPANGACGTAASAASATAPAANLCSVGSAGAIAGVGGQWSWSCAGSNGGTAAQCTAPYASQTLSISANPTSITFGGSSVITASSSAGLSVALAPNANCTLAGTTATGTAAGTCTVTASQAGTGDSGTLRYQAASAQSANITVGKASQAITGFSANPSSMGVGATSTLSATKGAGSAAVVYSSKTAATCTVAGNTVTAVTAGICTVAANQAESANHSAAPEVTANLTVTNAAPVASNVAVSGTAQVGVQLTGSYTYSDTESDAQGTSTFRWVRQSNPTVDVATTQNYTPVAADVGNALKFCVTPKASAGTATGTEVCSTATANVVAASLNGACGTAANVASATAPAANLCSAGTAGAVNVLGTNWSWSCSGTNGGNANSCTAPFANTNTGSGNTTTTVGAIQAANSNNWQINTAVSGFVALPAPAPAGVTLPAGATKVVLNTGTPGTSTTVTLRFSSIPEGAQLYKYGKENGINDTAKWFAYPATIDRAAGTVTYTLTDGQKGDNDWTVNGVIDDPVGLGVGAAGGAGAGISGVPTLSQWAMALLVGFMLLVGARQTRRRH